VSKSEKGGEQKHTKINRGQVINEAEEVEGANCKKIERKPEQINVGWIRSGGATARAVLARGNDRRTVKMKREKEET